MAKNYALLPEAVTMYTQTEALKDVKDMSKNLVSGEFEAEYRGTVMEKSGRRRRRCVAVFATALVALAVWLLVLTVVREVQLARLRHELDELSANMIAVTANLNSLNQKISNNRLFNEFKTLEDTIYADEDQDTNNGDAKNTNKEKQSYDSLEKLQGLTVLEDEDDMVDDDDDTYDGDDDAESGDWYPDYDRRREKIGTTNMVRLKPKDFTDSVLTHGEQKPASNSIIRELKRILNENPENPDIDFPTFTPPTESSESRNKRSILHDTSADSDDQKFAPVTFSKTNESIRKTKKYTPNVESVPSEKPAPHTVSRKTRNSEDEMGGRRPFVAAHFHGNTSHLSPEIHEHYKGNGLVRVSHDAAHDVWYPAPWTIASPHPRPTLTKSGHVRIHQSGIYFVYVQIYYLDTHDIISWVLHRTNPDMEGRETLLQCAQSAHSPEPLEKPNSCFSAGALFLRAGDKLAVRNTGGDRHSLMQPEKSFIGLIKLADGDDTDEDL